MTTEEIEKRVKRIAQWAEQGDDESAHMYEDRLYYAFVRYIATLETPLAEKAKLILKTEELNFERWYS